MRSVIGAATAAVFAFVCLSGCVSVFEGTSQDISVVTNPTGAHCAFKRDDGRDMGSIESTPAKLTVRKSKYDLTITCKKEGFQDAAYINHSGTSAGIAANVAVDVPKLSAERIVLPHMHMVEMLDAFPVNSTMA